MVKILRGPDEFIYARNALLMASGALSSKSLKQMIMKGNDQKTKQQKGQSPETKQ